MPQHHTYILNSTSLVGEVCEKLIAFKETINQVFLFIDNDKAGYLATHNIASNLDKHHFEVATLEQLYSHFKNLNAW